MANFMFGVMFGVFATLAVVEARNTPTGPTLGSER